MLVHSRPAKICALYFAAILISTNIGWAASSIPIDDRLDIEAQNQKTRQEEWERRQREQRPDVFLQKEIHGNRITKLPDETPSFYIQTILIEGDDRGKFNWLHDTINRYTGQKVGWQGINIIVKTATEACIDRGYITTRLLIPEQDLSSGVLRLKLVPGIIKDIKISSSDSRADWRSAFPARPGDILNLRDLEQGLEQMKRIPSQDVNLQLAPGDNPGESIVAINVNQEKPWKLIFSLDDSGSKATGKLQLSETFSLDNLLGMNDLFNISLNSNAEKEDRHGTRGNSFYYSFPQGYWTYTLTNSTYKYHQLIETNGVSFTSSGESYNSEIKAEKLIYRDQRQKSNLAFSLIKTLNRSFIDDTEIDVQRHKTSAAKLAMSHRQYNGQAVIDYTVAYKRGVPWFGAQTDPSETSSDQPTTHYNIWTLDASLMTPVHIGKGNARYSANLRGQYTKDILLGSDFFSIGNRYTVRGFDGEETLASENGWYLRNELILPTAQSGQELYIGLDFGQIAGPSAGLLDGKNLVGSTLGVRGSLSSAQYDVFLGIPIKKPPGFGTYTPFLGFQLIYQL